MDDDELMERAARAAGLVLLARFDGHYVVHDGRSDSAWQWEPLTDDGDALRLAVKLHIDFKAYEKSVRTWVGDPAAQRIIASIEELTGDDPCAATRRAIVRAAAAMAGEK